MILGQIENEKYQSEFIFEFVDGNSCEEIKAKLKSVNRDPLPSMRTARYQYHLLSSFFGEEHQVHPEYKTLQALKTNSKEINGRSKKEQSLE